MLACSVKHDIEWENTDDVTRRIVNSILASSVAVIEKNQTCAPSDYNRNSDVFIMAIERVSFGV